MDIIQILPHHAISMFEAFYLGIKDEDVISWYDNEKMRHNGVSNLKNIISNPDQLVQIVDLYDSWCSMCPRNIKGNNYDGNPDTSCHTYDLPNPDTEFIEILGLKEIANGKPITSKKFFELMKPTYEKLMKEPQYSGETSKRISLRQIFRVQDDLESIQTIY